jgi:hypothetical protein
MAPDEFFIRAFNSHISWPVKLTSEFLLAKSESDKGFNAQLQEWMAREQGWLVIRTPEGWRELVDRAARTVCYVFANRLIFYEAVRTKFENLKRLELRSNVKTPADLNAYFNMAFQRAIDESGDYETIFYPSEKDWAGPLIFQHVDSADAWRSVLGNLKPFNFKEIRTDVLGGIFKRLIAPEERHRFGQYYKALKDPSVTHQQRLREIYGADIAVFAAHLATLNLAARDITDEENYPRIARKNFFEIERETVLRFARWLFRRKNEGARRAANLGRRRRESSLCSAGIDSKTRAKGHQGRTYQGVHAGTMRAGLARVESERKKRLTLLLLAARRFVFA